MKDLVTSIYNVVWSQWLVYLCLLSGIYFSLRTRFSQVRNIKVMVKLLLSGEKSDEGISSFQGFCTALAGRIGTGNIAGVATAIAWGGPGALFWMWAIAFLGAGSAFAESTLGQLYKEKHEGQYCGGPAYYIEKGLNKRWLGLLFSILITITFGFVFNAVQANTITEAFQTAFGMDKLFMGIILAIVTAAVIFGGVQRIAKVSEIIVPVLAVAYVLVALLVIALNITKIPAMISLIVSNAFDFSSFASGAFGVMFIQGVKRGLFSNEAGMGSAPNAAATAEVNHPVQQGLIQTLGVFTDTILICSCTAFVILLSGMCFSSYQTASVLASIERENTVDSVTGNPAQTLETSSPSLCQNQGAEEVFGTRGLDTRLISERRTEKVHILRTLLLSYALTNQLEHFTYFYTYRMPFLGKEAGTLRTIIRYIHLTDGEKDYAYDL